MKKALILLVLVLVFTGCAKKDAANDNKPAGQTDTKNAPSTIQTNIPDETKKPDATDGAVDEDKKLVSDLKTALDSKDAELKALKEEINKLNKQLNDSKQTTTTKPTSTSVKPTSSKKLFYVIVGAFSTTENANKQRDILSKKGYDSYVIKSGKYFRVVCGTYSTMNNANAKKETLKKAGYDSFVLPSK